MENHAYVSAFNVQHRRDLVITHLRETPQTENLSPLRRQLGNGPTKPFEHLQAIAQHLARGRDQGQTRVAQMRIIHDKRMRVIVRVQRIGELAETQGHHPDISFGWGYVTVSLRTKKIKGLHENDFITAGRIDRIFNANNSD